MRVKMKIEAERPDVEAPAITLALGSAPASKKMTSTSEIIINRCIISIVDYDSTIVMTIKLPIFRLNIRS